ncbi:MAG TPA: M28 family peptidase [Solirubrobacteraceae bacterium]|nr:M28 family peptidase [Solirubrobacteraceae bacterium]
MLNGRLYRAGFAPVLIVLVVVGFSLTARPRPLASTLAPDAFEGTRAFAELRRLAGEFPDRRPGGAGDARLAARVASTIEGLGGAAGGGFQVQVRRFRAQTIDGERTLQTVIAQRPGASSESAIVILAHRDAAQPGSAAQLSGTAALLELARVFAARETQRPIVLVSTSGGSGGDAGAADFAAQAARLVRGGVAATIVLGDVASVRASRPLVVPYSDGYGSAPDELQRTVSEAIVHEAGLQPGAPSALGQLAHLAFGFAPGEQGALGAGGLGAVLVQVSGERGPGPRARVSAERVEGVGRATLSALDALDGAGVIEQGPQTGLVLARQVIPAWALRLLIGALLIGPLVVLVDGLARARRRGEPAARWMLWALTCGLPFFACALFARLLGALGGLPATPSTPVLPSALGFDGRAATAVLACALVLGLAWMAWPPLVRRLGLRALPSADGASESNGLGAEIVGARPRAGIKTGFGVRVGAGVGAKVGSTVAERAGAGADAAAGMAALFVLLVVAVAVWTVDPYAALLIVPGLHLLLSVASPHRSKIGQRPLVGLGLLALALVPLGLLIAFFAHQLGYGPGGVAQSAVLLVAGGHVGMVAAALWSVALGCGVAIALVVLTPPTELARLAPDERSEITIRGPLSYAGPGSLGGTESALRR